MKLKPRPTPPAAYLEYKRMPEGMKKAGIKNDIKFWLMNDVKEYLDSMEALENMRVSDIDHLEWLQKQLPIPNQEVEAKIQELKSDCYYRYGKGPLLNVMTGANR